MTSGSAPFDVGATFRREPPALTLGVLLLSACGATWNPDVDGVPRLAERMPVEVDVLAAISRFRSGAGHDFSDDVESCRSMKHYLWPEGGVPGQPHDPSWSTIEVRAPLAGVVVAVMDEQTAGSQVHIESTENPAFTVRLFHVTPHDGLQVGTTVDPGDLLGHNTSDGTYTDVAVEVQRPFGIRLVSFFELLTDDGFDPLTARGVEDRGALILTREERDADPLACDGEEFLQGGSDQDWVWLDPPPADPPEASGANLTPPPPPPARSPRETPPSAPAPPRP